jgi:hypothetical protein
VPDLAANAALAAKKARLPRKPPVLRPKSERDCRFCQENRRKKKEAESEAPIPWRLRKGKGGPKKKVATGGYFCPNENCEYYKITDEQTHALLGYGQHGVHEEIRDFKCQACGKKFTARQNTVLYRLKSHSGLVEKILWLLALGVDASALEEVSEVREVTIRTWLYRSGMQGRKLHERFLADLELIHVQLDELWANVKSSSKDMWLWVAHDASTKLIPVLQVGEEARRWTFRWYMNSREGWLLVVFLLLVRIASNTTVRSVCSKPERRMSSEERKG